jgi:hypothetical protein
MPRRERSRRLTSDAILNRIEKRSKACIATVSYWPDPGPPGCPPGSVMLLLMGCSGPCPTCDAARPLIWRVPPPQPALTEIVSFPPEL